MSGNERVTGNQHMNEGKTNASKSTVFTPQVETKVTRYFDTYKSNPHGLPPQWSTKLKAEKIPATWKSSRIIIGTTIPKAERDYLIEAPDDLLKVLPEPRTGVHYYVAGSNVVALNSDYKVVDAIRVPSIKIDMD